MHKIQPVSSTIPSAVSAPSALPRLAPRFQDTLERIQAQPSSCWGSFWNWVKSLFPCFFAPTGARKISALAERDGFIWFYNRKENPLTECFGNFYLHTFSFRGRRYLCAEAAFQAAKFEGYPTEMDQFIYLNGEDAWRLGQNLTQSWTPDQWNRWNQRKLSVMEAVIEEKFTSHDDLKNKLLSTKDAYLVEHNPVKGRDSFWSDDHDGTGSNQLGQILMIVREKCRGAGVQSAPPQYQTFLSTHQ